MAPVERHTCAAHGTRPVEIADESWPTRAADSLQRLLAVMERNVVDDDRPRTIETQFELFASKLMESWIASGSVQVSSGDLRMAAEFLQQVGWRVEEAAGLMVKLRNKDGRTREMTREAAILFAVRCLAGQETQP
jgi:hypothetical protein